MGERKVTIRVLAVVIEQDVDEEIQLKAVMLVSKKIHTFWS